MHTCGENEKKNDKLKKQRMKNIYSNDQSTRRCAAFGARTEIVYRMVTTRKAGGSIIRL